MATRAVNATYCIQKDATTNSLRYKVNKMPCRPYSHYNHKDQSMCTIQEIRLYCNGPALGEFKYCIEGPEKDMYLPFQLERKRTIFQK